MLKLLAEIVAVLMLVAGVQMAFGDALALIVAAVVVIAVCEARP